MQLQSGYAVKRRDGIATQFDPDIPLQSAQSFSAGDEKSVWYGIFYAVTW